MLERTTWACRLTSKAVDKLNRKAFMGTTRRTWKKEMKLLQKRFQDEREADESAMVEKDIFAQNKRAQLKKLWKITIGKWLV